MELASMQTHRSSSRITALCALGAAVIAFPAGIALGISGARTWYGPPPAVTGAVPAVAAAPPICPAADALAARVDREQALAEALAAELRRAVPDGRRRAARIREALIRKELGKPSPPPAGRPSPAPVTLPEGKAL
jgi:hypothetical protein